MTLTRKQGRSPKTKGTRNERKAAKELNRHLKTLEAVRVPGSGAFSHRRDDCEDPHFQGDLQVRREIDRRIMECVEVKVRDPGKSTITIATMDGKGWRQGRRGLMCRYDRGPFLCSVWDWVYDELAVKAGRDPGAPMTYRYKTRGITLTNITDAVARELYPIHWGAAVYMDVGMFAALLEEAHGDVLETPQ